MKTIFKLAVAATLTGAVALAAVSPSEARSGRNTAAAIGFGAGALVGAAVANNYYGPGYYAAEPAYVYDEPSYAYVPARRHYRSYRSTLPSCVSDGGYGRLDYGAC